MVKVMLMTLRSVKYYLHNVSLKVSDNVRNKISLIIEDICQNHPLNQSRYLLLNLHQDITICNNIQGMRIYGVGKRGEDGKNIYSS